MRAQSGGLRVPEIKTGSGVRHRQKLAARFIRLARDQGGRLEGESDSHKVTGQYRAMISGTVRAAPSWLALKGAACGSAPVCPAQQAVEWTFSLLPVAGCKLPLHARGVSHGRGDGYVK